MLKYSAPPEGSKDDVEALRGRFTLQQSTRKGLQMGSNEVRDLRRWKSVYVDASGGLGIYVNI